MQFSSCPSLFSIGVINIITQMNLGKERVSFFFLDYCPLWKEIWVRAQGRDLRQELKQRPGRNTLHWPDFHGLPSLLPIYLRATCPGMALLALFWAPLHLSFIKNMSPTAYKLTDLTTDQSKGNILSSYQITLAGVKWINNKNPDQHRRSGVRLQILCSGGDFRSWCRDYRLQTIVFNCLCRDGNVIKVVGISVSTTTLMDFDSSKD